MEFDGFDWDVGNWPKCGKHGLARDEIEAIFDRDDLLVFEDPPHSGGESRFLAIARGAGQRAGALVGFTWRTREGKRMIRPLTARYIHLRELLRYGGKGG